MTDRHAPAANDLAAALGRLFRTGCLVKQATHAREVEYGGLRVLQAVAEGPARISDIAATCHTDISTASRTITALLRAGLVDKTPDEHDRRAATIGLSPAGREALEHAHARQAEVTQTLLQGWTEEEIRALAASLNRLVDSIETHLTTHRPREER